MFEVVGQRRKEHPTWWATAISVVVHAVLVLLLVLGFRQTVLMAGEGDRDDAEIGRAGGGGGGGGGEQVSYYEVPRPPPPPPPTQPEPDALVPPEVPPLPPPVPVPPAAPAPPAPVTPAPAAPGPGVGQGPATGPGVGPGSGGGTGGGSGGGTGPGTGTGTGPGTGTGGGGGAGIIPPTPDLLLVPPNPPRGLGRREVELRLTISDRGAVTNVEILTPTGNRGYDEQLKRTARDWTFNPAREVATNRPVTAFYPVHFTL